jgi:regulator of sigma E protease
VIGFFYSLLAFIVAIGLLVVVHEFGHFWVARLSGVKILRFSVGFGRPLWGRRLGRDQTEFVVAAVPLGGYVKMLDEREGPVPDADAHREFNRQPLAVRTAIVSAGPLFNFLFAVLAYWAMFVIGVMGLRPLIGEVTAGSIAERAGLRGGDEIVAVASRPTPTWEAVVYAGIPVVIDGGALPVTARDARGADRQITLDLGSLGVDDLNRGNLLERLGIRQYRPTLPPIIGDLVAGEAAEKSGLKSGDEVLKADGVAIESWDRWVEYVQARPGRPIQVEVLRGGEPLGITLTPEPQKAGERVIGRIGAGPRPPSDADRTLLAVERYGPWEGMVRGMEKTWEVSAFTLKVFGKMLAGQASVQNLSGPLSIAQFAGQSASLGVVPFLQFLGIVSVSLAVLNLLPIPLLDGGHLLYYLIEFVSRRPVSVAMQQVAQQVGMVLLAGLMIIAIYNDIVRMLG